MITNYPTDSPEALAAIASPEPKHVWINGSQTVISTGADYIPAVVDITVSAWQIRKALNATGLRSSVETAVAAGSQDLKDAWEYAKDFERNNPLVNNLGMMLSKSSAELDTLFRLAASL